MNKEAKLKKWEGDLKLKDTIHSEQNKERLKLETYTMKQKEKEAVSDSKNASCKHAAYATLILTPPIPFL